MALFFRAGNQVRELGGLHRAGRVTRVVRTGPYARVYVQINGVGIVAFYPAQIGLI